MSKGIFITGTGTDIGKTYVTALLVKQLADAGYSAAYFKAAMSGNEPDSSGQLLPGDALYVKTVSGIGQPAETMCPYVYQNAVSPHLAARWEGNPVDLRIVREQYAALCAQYGFVTVEGSGGIVCPILYEEQKLFLEDIIRTLALPSLLVADAGLGTINSVVLTCEYMKARDLPVRGIIFNRFRKGDQMQEDNKLMCEQLTGIPVIACVPEHCKEFPFDAQALAALYA